MGIFADWSVWQLILVALGLTHVTIVGVTVFLHRSQAHGAVELGPVPYHFFRFWLWLTTSIVTREWVAIHRKHHSKCETDDDPHSPVTHGINKVLWGGVWLYRKEAKNLETLEKYGRGTPNDWLEKNLYTPYSFMGVSTMLLINVLLFGWAGLAIWVTQIVWIPFWAAGVINGVAHFAGYRSWNTGDASRNISPIGILIGGEELHNNHHAFAASARLSNQWDEIDIGGMYIRLMEMTGMAKVKKVAPRIKVRTNIATLDLEAVSTVMANRLQVLSNFGRQVVSPALKQELATFAKTDRRFISKTLKNPLSIFQGEHAESGDKQRLMSLLADNPVLDSVYRSQQQLHQFWEKSTVGQQAKRESMQQWIQDAESTGVRSLQQFAQRLRGYSTVT